MLKNKKKFGKMTNSAQQFKCVIDDHNHCMMHGQKMLPFVRKGLTLLNEIVQRALDQEQKW